MSWFRLITLLMTGGWALAARGPIAFNAQQSESASSDPAASSQSAIISKYCVGCHNQRLRTAGLALDALSTSSVGSSAEVWEKVVRKLRIGAMPPPGAPRPDKPAGDALVSGLEAALDEAAARNPIPGRTDTLHRLNRTEYQNAIRDLLALDVDTASLLPADDADGFDNLASLLSISPPLLERYMSAARKLSRLALGLAPPGPATDTYAVRDLATQEDHASDDLPFGTRGGLAIRHYFPVDGEYQLKIRLRRQIYDYVTGLDRPEQLEIRVDGERVKTFATGGEDHGKTSPQSFGGDIPGSPEWERYALSADEGLVVRLPVKSGPRVVGVSFVGTFTEPEGVVQPRERYAEFSRDETRDQGVDSVAISGPYRVTGPGDTPSRRRILICSPSPAGLRRIDELPCARRILSTLAHRAYRRPVTEPELQTLLGFFRAGRREGTFDAGLQFAVERILADPSFLFRVEQDAANVAQNAVYRVSDLELASRLSFFLWSSLPDEELLDVAERGHLNDPTVLDGQVRRMLADRRAAALVDNFAGQWLLLRNLRNLKPTPDVFPDFDESLREAFQRETELFLSSQLHEDRSVVELLSANYTFVNERLARHYEIPDIHGRSFRRVTFSGDAPRGGLLGQGSLLAVTSYPNRTSPVLRGRWVLDSLLGMPPPAPPPDVPNLEERGEDGKPASVRARLEAHRKSPSCAGCHAPMDPLGFALENFDGIGKWRTINEAGTAIDASAAFLGGATFEGPAGLRAFLLGHRDQFVGTVIEKLLTYALGRKVQYYDLPAVRKIRRESASNDYRWSSVISGIVKSTPFQMRTSRG
jgi:mono/diheme cytochrome c family protein